MNPVIVNDIHKHYGDVQALRGVSFEAGRGEIFGIIGPDGAGKTSLFRIMTTLILPDSGSCRVAGEKLFYTLPDGTPLNLSEKDQRWEPLQK